MPNPITGSSLYNNAPHSVDIYLPTAPTTDSGGGVKLGFPTTPSQKSAPCQINTSGASRVMRQGQNTITVGNKISFLTSLLTVTLTQGAKLVATDTGRTFIIDGLTGPNRQMGGIPAFTYVDASEIL